jgi:hypothetical protein
MGRLTNIPAPIQGVSPEYIDGLRAAVSAAMGYLVSAIERPLEESTQTPAPVLRQVGMAARTGTSLDTVLRRCFAGYTLFGDFLIEEAASRGILQSPAMKQVLRAQASLFDQLVAAATEEYLREASKCSRSPKERRGRLVEQLLAGELCGYGELAYDFEIHHLGVVAKGVEAADLLVDVAASLDSRLLGIERGEEIVWAWLGSRRTISADEMERLVAPMASDHLRLAVGETAEGLRGWRLTHQQARAALPIALRGSKAVTRYTEVALLASAIQDDVLTTSLRARYLAPLAEERDEGKAFRETLRAYLVAERNVSSAAAALGVNRRTVANRICSIEERIGQPLHTCAAEIELALRLDRHGSHSGKQPQ